MLTQWSGIVMESVEIMWELAVAGFVAGRLIWSSDVAHQVPVEASGASSLDGNREMTQGAKNGACR